MLPRGSNPSSWLINSSIVRCTSLELPSPSLYRVPVQDTSKSNVTTTKHQSSCHGLVRETKNTKIQKWISEPTTMTYYGNHGDKMK